MHLRYIVSSTSFLLEQILTRNKVLSAPVKDPHEGKVTGIIDMFDLLTSLLRVCSFCDTRVIHSVIFVFVVV